MTFLWKIFQQVERTGRDCVTGGNIDRLKEHTKLPLLMYVAGHHPAHYFLGANDGRGSGMDSRVPTLCEKHEELKDIVSHIPLDTPLSIACSRCRQTEHARNEQIVAHKTRRWQAGTIHTSITMLRCSFKPSWSIGCAVAADSLHVAPGFDSW